MNSAARQDLPPSTETSTPLTGLPPVKAKEKQQPWEMGKGVDKLEYRLKGRLVTGNFGGYDFDQKGELDPARLLRDGRPARPASEQF